ncbi:MAG: hypothetical protein AB8U25_06545 [Rickettsiales endosymbiont of Dermacentor nuttalli]
MSFSISAACLVNLSVIRGIFSSELLRRGESLRSIGKGVEMLFSFKIDCKLVCI